jgi:CBS domain-containing protein
MKRNPVTVQSSTPTLEAIEIMRREKVGCLPVVDDGLLVGIVTSFDFLEASGRLFKEYLVPAEVTNQKKRATAHGRSNS